MLKLDVDIGPLADLDKKLRTKAESTVRKAAASLAVMTRNHITQEVQKKLKSTREAYLQNLSYKQVDANTWSVVLTLDPSKPNSKLARAIEDGMDEHEMIEDLLKSDKAKTAKDGSKYLSVPFKHNAPPTKIPDAAMTLHDTVKQFLKEQKIPWGKIEKNADGSPKLGLLHSRDLTDKPLKLQQGPYQGKGPVGAVRQGPTGIPFLQGIRVYQSMVQGPNGPSVQRGVFTFRTVSSKMKGTGRWVHPGLKARKFFDEAFIWAKEEWDKKIKKQVLDSVFQ